LKKLVLVNGHKIMASVLLECWMAGALISWLSSRLILREKDVCDGEDSRKESGNRNRFIYRSMVTGGKAARDKADHNWGFGGDTSIISLR
jgi:hypothetical protein